MNTLKTYFFNEQSRYILWAPVFFGIGIICAFTWNSLPYTPWGIALLILPVPFIHNKPLARLFITPIILLGSGFWITQWHVTHLNTAMIIKPLYTKELTGTVQKIETAPYGRRLTIKVDTIQTRWPIKKPPQVKLTLRGQKDVSIHPGDYISAPAKLTPIQGPLVPNGFDFRRRAFFDSIGASGFIAGAPIIKANSKNTWQEWWEKHRHIITEKITSALSGYQGAIAAALITGDKAGLTNTDRDIFADAGIAHILAISGLHLSLVGGCLFVFFSLFFSCIPPFALRFPIKKIAASISIVGLFFYLQISGAAVPSQRAFFMALLVLWAVIVDRNPISMRIVALVVLLLLTMCPGYIVMPSFQLSFAAVIALTAFYESSSWWFTKKQSKLQKIWSYFKGIMLTSLIASLATLPFTVYHFQKFTVQGILTNLLVIPIIAFWIMPLAIIAVTLIPLGLSGFFFHLMGSGIVVMYEIGAHISTWPGAAIMTGYFPPWGFLCSVFGFLWMCLWQEKWRWWGIVFILIGGLSFIHRSYPTTFSSPDNQTKGFVENNILWVSSTRRHTFLTETWRRYLGFQKPQVKNWKQYAKAIA